MHGYKKNVTSIQKIALNSLSEFFVCYPEISRDCRDNFVSVLHFWNATDVFSKLTRNPKFVTVKFLKSRALSPDFVTGFKNRLRRKK